MEIVMWIVIIISFIGLIVAKVANRRLLRKMEEERMIMDLKRLQELKERNR